MSMFIVVPRASVLSPLAQRGWRHLVLWVAKVMGAAFGDESIVLPFCRRVVRLLPASAGASACGIVVPGSGKLMVCPSSLSAADLECSSRGAAVHRCAARRQLLDHRNHLGLDHRVWLSKAADPDRRAGRRRHPEVAHAYVGAVRERLVVRDESIGLDDIGPSRAGGLEAGVEVLEGLLDLGPHVARADDVAFGVACQLAGDVDRLAGAHDRDDVRIGGLALLHADVHARWLNPIDLDGVTFSPIEHVHRPEGADTITVVAIGKSRSRRHRPSLEVRPRDQRPVARAWLRVYCTRSRDSHAATESPLLMSV